MFEDLHWIDSETQALLDSLVESLPTARLLLLVNYRPEYQHGWGSKTYYTQLRLDPLPPVSAEEFLQALLGDDPSLKPLTDLLIARTEGNPFFLEESVRTLAETGVLVGERGAYRLGQALAGLQVPATVQAVLAARIDRLPAEEKRLLQTAAVIGTEVPLPLLHAIADVPEAVLQRHLTALQSAEFLYETRLFPEHEYTFKHALTHEVAYGSLLLERRRVLHARIVEALEALAGEPGGRAGRTAGAPCPARGGVGQGPGVLPTGRGEGPGAVGSPRGRGVLRAGAGCPPASARDSVTHASRPSISGSPCARRSSRLGTLGVSWRVCARPRPSRRPSTTLVGWAKSRALCQTISTSGARLTRLSPPVSAPSRWRTASGDVVLQALANLVLGYAYHAQGAYRRAIDCHGQTVAALDGARRHERFGQVILPAVNLPCLARLVPCRVGHVRRGQRPRRKKGCGLLRRLAPREPHGCLLGIGLLSLRQGDLPRALPRLERAVGICQDADLPAWFPRIAAALGAAYTLGGRIADAVPLLTQAMEQATATESVYQALCSLSLGEAQLLADRLEEAQALAEQALALTREHQERGHEAYALRLLGDIAARRDPPESERP